MLVELSINPLGRGTHLSKDLGEILKLIDDSGLRYGLTPLGTCIEGDWDQVMALIKSCHQHVRTLSPHVFTTLRIEDANLASQIVALSPGEGKDHFRYARRRSEDSRKRNSCR